MAKKMTICDAVDAFELYDLFNEILETYELDFYTRAELDSDLRDLIEEHDDLYEFSLDENGAYEESLERNLKEALTLIFDKHGVVHRFDDEFLDEAMDDEDIDGIYSDGLEERSMDDMTAADDDSSGEDSFF
jgi:hypothetical protein